MQTQSEPAGPSTTRAILWLLAAANFAIGMGAFVVVGVLNPIAAWFSIDKGQASWVMTAYAIVYAIASPLLMAWTGAVARRKLLAAGLLVFAAGAALAALAPSFEWLLVARVLMAWGGGIVTPVAASVGVAVAGVERRGQALAVVFGGLTLAQVLGVPVGAWLGYTFGWQSAFAAVTALTLLAAWSLYTQLPAQVSTPTASVQALLTSLRSPPQMLAVLFTALFVAAMYTLYTFFAPLLEARHGMGANGVTLMFTVFGVCAVLGNSMGGWLTDRVGPFKTLLLLACVQAVVLPSLSLLNHSVWLTALMIGVLSVFGWSFMVPQQVRLAAIDPPRTPVLFALNASAIYVGASLGSAIGAALLARAGISYLGLGGLVLALLAAASLLVVQRLVRPLGGARLELPR